MDRGREPSCHDTRAMSIPTEPAKRRSFALMRTLPGDRVLDVGCGPGTDPLLLARLVGESGQVVDVDYDQLMT
jgi:ubiquinone/menaquinone biosynthesis C-methylase UbiE